jgi:hypothetical protein
MFGTNDGDAAPEVVIAEYEKQLYRLNLPVCVCAVFPAGPTYNNAGTFDAATPRWAWILRFNALLVAMCARSGGRFSFADTYSALVDPLSPTGLAKAGVLSDDLHTNNLGAYLAVQPVVDVIAPKMTSTIDRLTSAANSAALLPAGIGRPLNALRNGMFNLVVGGQTVATDFTVAAAAGAAGTGVVVTATSVEASFTGVGSEQKFTYTTTTDATGITMQATSVHAFIKPGDTVFAQAAVKISAAVALRCVRLQLLLTVNGTSYTLTDLQTVPASEVALPGNMRPLLLRTPEFKIPAGAVITNAVWVVSTRHIGAVAGGATAEVAHGEVRCLPDGMV